MSNFVIKIVSQTVMAVLCLSTLCMTSQVFVADVLRRIPRQVIEENGVTIRLQNHNKHVFHFSYEKKT